MKKQVKTQVQLMAEYRTAKAQQEAEEQAHRAEILASVEADFAQHEAARAAERKALEDKERAEHERREQERQAQAQAILDAEKRVARQAYLAGGGTPDDFEKAWPVLRDDILRQRARQAIEANRAHYAAQVHELF